MYKYHWYQISPDLMRMSHIGYFNGPLLLNNHSAFKSQCDNYSCKMCQTSNISHTIVGNKIVDHSDVVGAVPTGTAPTTSSFSTKHLASIVWAKTTAR